VEDVLLLFERVVVTNGERVAKNGERRTAREGWTGAQRPSTPQKHRGDVGVTPSPAQRIAFKKIRTAAGDCSSFGSLYTSPNIVTLAFASPPHPGICITRLHLGSSMMFRVWMASGESAKIGQPCCCWVEEEEEGCQ